MHDVTGELNAELKKNEKMTTQYHKWTAYTAAAQHNDDMPTDHVKRDPNYTKKRIVSRKKAKPKPDQKVLNRMPFAKGSQGIPVMHGPQLQANSNQYQLSAEARIVQIRQRTGLRSATLRMTRLLMRGQRRSLRWAPPLSVRKR